MTDQLEDLFAGLRADTLTEVRAPGTEAVRRTVHRRRTTRTVGAAAFVAVVAAGGLGSHLLGPADPRTADSATLAKRQSRAAGAAGIDPQTPRGVQGVAAAGVIATQLLVAGTYTVRLACAGPGRLTVLFRIRPATEPLTSATRDCAASAARTATFTLVATATVETELRPDDRAAGRSGYAVRLTVADADLRRLSTTAMDRLAPHGRADDEPAAGTDAGVDTWTPAAGGNRLRYTCAGVGHVAVTLSVDGTTTTRDRADCVSGAVRLVDFGPVTGDHSTANLMITPDAEARGQAGYAYLIEPR